jgi:ribosomal protein S17E
MRYLKGFNEGFDTNKEWIDMSPEEREETSIPKYSEENIDSIISKIKEEYPEANDKSDLVEMICWYEDKFKKDIEDEDEVIDRLTKEYNL